jgi:hypothetical protein
VLQHIKQQYPIELPALQFLKYRLERFIQVGAERLHQTTFGGARMLVDTNYGVAIPRQFGGERAAPATYVQYGAARTHKVQRITVA